MKTKSDRVLQQDIMAELEWKFPLKPSEIGVSVKDGIVTLSGFTDSFYKKKEAERTVEKIEGVKAIVEKIEVKLPGNNERTDEDIAKATSNALRWDVNVPDDKIKIIVNQARVTLEGEVEWNYQKIAAENAVENLLGVKGVTNTIMVKPKVKIGEVTEHIKNAFKRNAIIDAEGIRVELEGNKVILKGRVRSLVEKRDAEKAALLTPGVTTVDNQLDISYEPIPS